MGWHPVPSGSGVGVIYSTTSVDFKNIDLSKLSSEELDTLLDQLESLSQRTPYDYRPGPKQKVFHCAQNKIRFLSGGNRSGKTEAGTWEDVVHATGLYPDWFPAENRLPGPNRGRVVVTDYAKGGSVYEEKLFKWLPKELIESVKRTVKGALEKVEVKHALGGTSVIEVLTHEQDPMVFEGWSGHWAHFDEPPPRECFIATLRGLIDFKGRCWLTLTPISEPWLYDEFIAEQNEDILFLTVDIWDNAKSRGGHLPDEEIRFFESTLTEDEKEARLHGRFRHLTGLVYKEFDPAVHVIPKAKVNVQPNWPKYFVCDPHDRKPHFGIWATVDPLGQIYIIDEIKYKGTIKEFSKAVILRELMNKEYHIKPMEVIRIGDPNKMNTPTAVTGTTFLQEFSSHGLFFLATVNDDIALGHLTVAEALHYDKNKAISSTNKPRLYFVKETTQECVKYMQRYVWDEWKSGKGEKSAKEKPKDNFKDFPDTIRYLVMSKPAYFVDDGDPTPEGKGSVTGYGR